MPRPIINTDECTACGICVDSCPNDVLEIVDDASTVVNEDSCVGCGICMEDCPMSAIEEIEED